VKKISRYFLAGVVCFWLAVPTGLMADGNPFPICPNGQNCRALVDTNTTLQR
jgi:hypothetical protein